jgi:hypothetical protein
MNMPVTTLDQRYSDPDAVAVGFDETCKVLETAELFWISTVRADGRPHVTPVVAVWAGGAICFSTGAGEQKFANLLLREVVGYSTAEISSQLGTSAPAVNSALRRARTAARDRLAARSQQATLRSLGDQRTRAIAERYADAIERADADALISMLTEDATWYMPPEPTRFGGREAIREFLVRAPLTERWQHRATRANGQLAVGCYLLDRAQARYVPNRRGNLPPLRAARRAGCPLTADQ